MTETERREKLRQYNREYKRTQRLSLKFRKREAIEGRKYYGKNKTKIRKRWKQYYTKNREKLLRKWKERRDQFRKTAPIDSKIPTLLLNFRTLRGLSQGDIAKVLEISVMGVNYIENGRVKSTKRSVYNRLEKILY
jgi:ribosome-binding protein aMBF1 (putative translation factor)